jgi:hypothetical protein
METNEKSKQSALDHLVCRCKEIVEETQRRIDCGEMNKEEIVDRLIELEQLQAEIYRKLQDGIIETTSCLVQIKDESHQLVKNLSSMIE